MTNDNNCQLSDAGVRNREPAWPAWGKRSMDAVCAVVLLVLTAPLMVLAALLVKLTSRGPAIYSQIRLGRGDEPYTIYKIRTMYHDCEEQGGGGPQWSRPGDVRVIPVGRFLRATHLDELPQLWNVLRGEMSLVGPRPERPYFAAMLQRSFTDYTARHQVRPGVTGLAQVQLAPDTSFESVRRKLQYDLFYMQHSSFFLDLRILLSTATGVLGLPFWVTNKLLRLPDQALVEGRTPRGERIGLPGFDDDDREVPQVQPA